MSETLSTAIPLDVRDGVLYGFGRWDGEPLDWTVLKQIDDLPDGRMLLLCRRAVAARAYDGTADARSWPACDLHDWLNGAFLNEAFSAEERERMPDCAYTGRVFVPEESQLPYDPKEKAFGTAWWLRDDRWEPCGNDTPCIRADGEKGQHPAREPLSVFPALWISPFSRQERLDNIQKWEASLLKEQAELKEKRRQIEQSKTLPYRLAAKLLKPLDDRAYHISYAIRRRTKNRRKGALLTGALKAADAVRSAYHRCDMKMNKKGALEMNNIYLSNVSTQLDWIRTIKEEYGFIPSGDPRRRCDLEQRALID